MEPTGAKAYRPSMITIAIPFYLFFLIFGVIGVLTDPTFKPPDFIWYALAAAPLACAPALVIVLASPITVSDEGVALRPNGFRRRFIPWDGIRSARPAKFLWLRYAVLTCEGIAVPVWLPLDLQRGRFAEDLKARAPAGNPLRTLLETGQAAQAQPAVLPVEPHEDDAADKVPAPPHEEAAIRANITDEAKLKSGADWFFWIAGLSVLNTVTQLLGWSGAFIAGLAVTQAVDAVLLGVSQALPDAAFVLRAAGAVFGAAAAGLFVLFGVFARKRHAWAFVTGMTLYALDAVLCLVFGDWLAAAFHALALWGVFSGYRARGRLAGGARR